MKVSVANEIRNKYLNIVKSAFEGEDVGLIASNAINFPIVTDDGEEGWIEITVKIPKEDEGYDKREEYRLKVEAKEEKAKETAAKKAKKIAEDTAKREAKKKAKEAGE